MPIAHNNLVHIIGERIDLVFPCLVVYCYFCVAVVLQLIDYDLLNQLDLLFNFDCLLYHYVCYEFYHNKVQVYHGQNNSIQYESVFEIFIVFA